MKGYKVFNSDWSCRGFRYEVGKTYEIKDKLILCLRGFHFCENLNDCFKFYDFAPKNKVAEVEALGEVIGDDGKFCTNKITVVRELSWEEVLRTINTGRGNTGRGDSGNHNSGDFNSGSCNSGDYNSGNFNSGSCNSGSHNCGGDYNSGDFNSSGSRNSGNYNTGSCNSGWSNSGNSNSGDFNSGDFNSGDFNATDYSSGCFNTTLGTIRMFNRPTSWTLDDWNTSDACAILRGMPIGLEWVTADKMPDEAKAEYPEAEITGGCLTDPDNAMRQKWWDCLNDTDKATVKSIPNFDAKIFEQITGIKVQERKKDEH